MRKPTGRMLETIHESPEEHPEGQVGYCCDAFVRLMAPMITLAGRMRSVFTKKCPTCKGRKFIIGFDIDDYDMQRWPCPSCRGSKNEGQV